MRAKRDDSALYMYAIGRQDRLRKMFAAGGVPEGVEKGAPVALITQGELAAVVSEVPLNQFGEGRFEENLQDPMWAAETVMRHETVTEFVATHSTVVPLRFGVMYSTPERIRTMLETRASHLKDVLSRLEDCEEWALNVYVDQKKLHDQMAELSPRLAEMHKRVQASSPGRAYLLEKKLGSLRAAESKTESRRMVQTIFSILAGDSRAIKDLLVREAESKQQPSLVGKSAFLIERRKLKGFRRSAEKLAKEHARYGYSLELTGPWPPYNFSE